MFKKSLYFILTIFLFIGCHKDYESGEDIQTPKFMPEIKTLVKGSILGYVYNDQNLPVEGAVVEIFGAQTTTDKFGVFHFKNADLDAKGTFIRIQKPGYLSGSDKVFPSGGIAYSKTRLFSLSNFEKLNAATGGIIKISGGGTLNFPENSIADSQGNPYIGIVNVTTVFLSPKNPLLSDEMPGELMGGNTKGIYAVLGTAGMFGVELRSEQGQKLNVMEGKKVKFVLPAESNTKPQTVPMWHFDDNRGYWIEEGVASLVDGNYVGEVSHFSFWNIDVPYPLIELCGSVLAQGEKPIAGISVSIEAEGLGVRNGYVDSEGKFCGLVPKGKKLTFKFKKQGCPDIIAEVEVGPFAENTLIDPIILSVELRSIEGEVTCENTPVTDGVVVITYNGFPYHTLLDENGKYFYQIYTCNNSEDVEIFAYDRVTYKASSPENITINTSVVKNLQVCSTVCQIDGAIENKCDYLEMVIANGSGTVYDFTWSTGDSSSIATNLPITPRTICVTVEDASIPNCSQTFCYDYGGKLFVNIETECFNPMAVYPSGGVQPYTYLWHNGKTTQEVVLSDGESYCVTVTDKVGCTAKFCGVFSEIFLDPGTNSCDKDKFSINSSNFNMATLHANNQTIAISTLQDLSVFQTGFNFGIDIGMGQCSEFREYRLPQFNGLSIANITHTSCGGCTDGFIDFAVSGTGVCTNCTTGGVKIFNIQNLNNDLSTVNAIQMLPSGEYYVVVEDANTGCYVAFKKVKVD